MRKNIVCVFAAALLFSCGNDKNTIKGKIISSYKKECSEQPCYIDIRNVTDFSWDSMFVFGYGNTIEEIHRIVPECPNTNNEFTKKIIFKHNNKIVLYEEYEVKNIERLEKNDVVFDMSKSKNYHIYTSDNANFSITKKKFEYGVYYELEQVKK